MQVKDIGKTKILEYLNTKQVMLKHLSGEKVINQKLKKFDD